MKGFYVLVGCGLLVGVIAWLQKSQRDAMNEPDLPERYRAAWNIPNDEIRKKVAS